MTILGAAPKIAIPTFSYLIITIIIDRMTRPLFIITHQRYIILLTIAIILILGGAIIVAAAGRKLLKSYKADVLMTDGPYRIVRNPMYVAYLIFVIPGICLLFNSWLVLTTVLVNFILLKLFIRAEYRYLEDKFGDEYRAYLKEVWFKFF